MSARGDLIGRDAELAAASAFLDELGGGPCALLLTGESGIGKTALWKAIVRLAGVVRRGHDRPPGCCARAS